MRSWRRASASERCLVARYEGRQRDSAKAWVDATLERFGRIDALVNNAGIAPDSPVEEESEDALDDMWLVNVDGLNMPFAVSPGDFEDIAELVATVLNLPNNAAIAELLVNMRHEESL